MSDTTLPWLLRPFEALGRTTIAGLEYLGRFGAFLGEAVLVLFTPPLKVGALLRRIQFIGFRSLIIILLTGAFTGMVLALQLYLTLTRFGSEAFLGPALAISIIRELGPVLSALMVTGRAGSALTAEIGIMRITEQIDALTVMALNPMRYLVAPSILAGVLTFPLITAIFDAMGLLGGHLIAVELLGLSSGTYFGEIKTFVDMGDILTGFWKSLSFGVIVTWVATYKGFYVGHGAEGVARATTQSVVLASVLILVWDYFMGSVLPFALIKVQGLTKSFRGQPVLRGIDLEVPTGSITGVIGRSGGGKTVLLRHLIGLLRPDAGSILVEGVDITRLSGAELDAIRRRYGVVFQGGALFDSLTCAANVAFPLREKFRAGPGRGRRAGPGGLGCGRPGGDRAANIRPRSRAGCASGWPSPAP